MIETTPFMRSARVSICPYDEEPLVFTFVFPGKEWYCPRCKRAYAFVEARSAEATEKRLAVQRANDEAFTPLASRCIAPGVHRSGCRQCRAEPHRAL